MRDYEENLRRLVDIYNESLESNLTPKETARAFVDEVGIDNARKAIAAAMAVKSWDGRISNENREYWTPIGKEYGFSENMRIPSVLDYIHPAHLEQITEEIRYIVKQQETATQTQTAPAEETQERRKTFPIEVAVTGDKISDDEIAAYVEHAQKKNPGNVLKGVEIKVDGDYVDLKYSFKELPFERIRRITGYLVGTLDRFNDAKRAEVDDRVKHSLGSEQQEDIYLQEKAAGAIKL